MRGTPYYSLVPKDPLRNVAFRRECLKLAREDRRNARRLWAMCRDDLLFYVNTFWWTYDPRLSECPVIPFISYPFQDDGFLAIRDAIEEGHDLVIEKSRDMGVSWMICGTYEWKWHFYNDLSFMMVSRKEDLVDKTGNMDALFQKVDFIHEHLPRWMLPNMVRQRLHLENLDTGSCIDGESTNSDAARGGRKTSLLLDEFAFVENDYSIIAGTRDVTKCRIVNSSSGGYGNAFYDIVTNPKWPKLRFHWTLHPKKNQHLRYVNGKPTNEWYEAELARCLDPREAARELDIDYTASDSVFFDVNVLERVRAEDIRPPFVTGEILHDGNGRPEKFVEDDKGRLKLWLKVDESGRPPGDRYYGCGVDVATGTRDLQGVGYSNSCIVIVDGNTGEKVAEFAAHGVEPQDLARYAVALCKWFGGLDGDGAHLCWEKDGPGGLFGNTVWEMGYRNIWWDRDESSVKLSTSYRPGWKSSPESKRLLLGRHKAALADRKYIERSIAALNEYRMYVHLASGSVAHSRAEKSEDPTGARKNHGDRVIASALASRAAGERRVVEKKEEDTGPKRNTLAWRHEQAERDKREACASKW